VQDLAGIVVAAAGQSGGLENSLLSDYYFNILLFPCLKFFGYKNNIQMKTDV